MARLEGQSGMSDHAQALLSVEQTYAADRAAAAAGVPGVELMENAGAAVAEAVQRMGADAPVLVLCGPGNNGGDGFVAARLLAEAGREVRLALLGLSEALRGDAAHHAALWRGEVLALGPGLAKSMKNDQGSVIVVDALFGAGLTRPLDGVVRALAEEIAALRLPVVAVDVPSGLSGDSGEALGGFAFKAQETVTFFRPKPGHLLLPGRSFCGHVTLADIGVPDSVLDEIAPSTWENGPGLWAGALTWREPGDHKYRFGHAVVLGGAAMTGAARLAARAALRVGAGLVTVAAPTSALPIYAADCASVITTAVDDGDDFESLIEDRRKNAILLGPGAGQTADLRRQVLAALAADGRAVALDADALSLFAGTPEALLGAIDGPVVLTPHEGEFARLFPDLADSQGGDKLSRAKEAAERSGAVILLKGADTVIAAPDGRAAINTNAPPELATAGSGDVLAGLVVGLLAQGLPAFEAGCAAAWLHGATASRLGPGMISDDLPEALPPLLAWLKEQCDRTLP